MSDLIEKLPVDNFQVKEQSHIELLKSILPSPELQQESSKKELIIVLVSLIGSLMSRVIVTKVTSDENSIIITQIVLFIILYGVIKYLLS